ncbi:MAG TPA: hypothetical protein VFR97_04520 [Capillimicrobium sp.]|nr:hypothetical protein [Capillimicrobium sp.]
MRWPAAAAAVLALAGGAAGCGGGDADRGDHDAELQRIRREIAADAERRGGEPVRRVRCEPSERTGAPAGSLDCLAITDESPPSDAIPVPITLGQPYAARIDPDTGRAAWCRVTPVAGEGATPSPEDVATLPERCGGSG